MAWLGRSLGNTTCAAAPAGHGLSVTGADHGAPGCGTGVTSALSAVRAGASASPAVNASTTTAVIIATAVGTATALDTRAVASARTAARTRARREAPGSGRL